MTSMTDVTNADRRRWQNAALAALLDLLTTHPDLPVVTWRVTPGIRAAAVLTTIDGDEARLRGVLEVYAHALGTDMETRDFREPDNGFSPGEQTGRLVVSCWHRRAEIFLSAPLYREAGTDGR